MPVPSSELSPTPQPVYLIDASIYIFRAYFSIPDEWFSPEGYSVNALHGYTQFLLKFLQRTRPERLAAAYDESLGSCFRNDIYPGYKESRALPDEELAFQLEACKRLTELLGIVSPASERYEADDIIASLATQYSAKGFPISIVSRDKDLGQLLANPGDRLWDFAADTQLNQSDFCAHYGVRPDQLIDFLALVGDSIDDIPGVPGIGKKTAAVLLQQFGSIERMQADLSAVANSGMRGAAGISRKLSDHGQLIEMAKQLVQLKTNITELQGIDLVWRPPGIDTLRYYLQEFGLAQRFESQLQACYWWQF